jgi:diadenosine tetraphosphate (Ap4A) HIT family hydrolase
MTARGCRLCAIVSGTADATVLRCWPDVIAVVDPESGIPGQLRLIATEHFDDVASAPHVAGVVMVAAAEIASDYPRCDIIATHGPAHPGGEPRHLHLDLIPRTPPREFGRAAGFASLADSRGGRRISRRPE